MKNLLGIIAIFLLSFQTGSAQNFEGIVQMQQETNGMTYEMVWYIKKDKIAYDIKSKSDKGGLNMRFVPQPKQNTMLMIVQSQSGNSKTEIAARDISGIDMSDAEVKELGTKVSPDFGNIRQLIITTSNSVTEVEVASDIDVKLAKYASFLKSDYGMHALILSNQVGFPLNSVTKDKNGQILSKTKVISVTKTAVSDSYFQ